MKSHVVVITKDAGRFPHHEWRVHLLAPYQVNSAVLDKTGNPRVRSMHPLPTFHDKNTVVGRDVMENTGFEDGLEVTHEVFERL